MVLTLWLSRGSGWREPRFWRNAAVVSSLIMSGILVYLTIDSLNQIREGSARVPAYTGSNKAIAASSRDPNKPNVLFTAFTSIN